MGKATIQDAFNASINFGKRVTGYATEKLKEQNDLEISVDSAKIQTNIQNWIRDNQYTGAANEEGDNYAYSEYLSKLNYYIDEQYATISNNYSHYYKQQMGYLREQSLEAARNYSLNQQDEWRISREIVHFNNDVQTYMSAGWDPQKTLGAINNRIALSKTNRPITPQQENELRQAAERAVYEKFAVDYLGRINDVNQLEAAMNYVHSAFGFMPSNAMNIYDEAGNVTGTEEQAWGFHGKDEWEKALLKNETARIHGEHFEAFREKQAYFERMIMHGELEAAIAYAKVEGAKWNKYYNTRNPERANTNEEYLDRGSGFFDYRTIEAHLNSGGKPEDITIPFHWRTLLTAAINGNEYTLNGKRYTFKGIEDAVDKVLFIQREAFLNARGNTVWAMEEWQNVEEGKLLKGFYDEFRDFLKDTNPSLLEDFDMFMRAETYTTRGGDYYHEDFTIDRAQSAISFFKNLIYRQGITDTAVLRDKMRDFTGKRLLQILTEVPVKNTEEEQIIKNAEISRTLMGADADDMIFLRTRIEDRSPTDATGSKVIFRNNDQGELIQQFAERERLNLANKLGINPDDLTISWMTSGNQKGDIIPKAQFTSISTGEVYYMDYDESSNEVVKIWNKSINDWDTQGLYERQLTRDEIANNISKTLNDYNQSISTNVHPITGNVFSSMSLPPPDMAIPISQWGNARNTETMRNQSWAAYFVRLMNDPQTVISQSITNGKNPLTGQSININDMPPTFNGGPQNWARITNLEEKKRYWYDFYYQQLGTR